MRSCGIDLGTTNSCVVVVRDEEHHICHDEYGNRTFPSVVHEGRNGRRSVGLAARNRIGESPAPVGTIKRKMGSTETVLLGGRQQTPVEISGAILSYLREVAETQAGEKVTRAVVTVPAYFNHVQRQQTHDAAKLAGFRQVTTLLEPVAAALAYSLGAVADGQRIFVFDLGGGTFDATILEKDRNGSLTVLSFGGDPHLGGDDIDARFARLILHHLTDAGFRLDLHLENPEDYTRFQRLKFYAEIAKQALSDAESYNLVRPGLFEDQDGAAVDLDMVLTRSQLEACAQDLIQRAIDAAAATLNGNGRQIPIESLDEVIMVGGMSRMPLVQAMVERMFGRKPKLVDPDLIVAKGAALKAAEIYADQVVSETGLQLELRYDRQTDQDRIRVSGVFDRPLSDHTVYLIRGRDEISTIVDGADRFMFEDVALERDCANTMIVSVEDAGGQPVLERSITVQHRGNSTPVLASPGAVVTKAISILTLAGPHVLFPENTPLPHKMSHTFETADRSGRIVAPILEGEREVDRLEIHDIPAGLAAGSRVVIEVAIEDDYSIHARASVPDLNRDVHIEFRIKPVDVSQITPEFVAARLAELGAQAEPALAACTSSELAEITRFELEGLRDQIETELGEPEPKRQKLQELLLSMESKLARLPGRDRRIELKPTFDEFCERLTGIVTRAVETGHEKLAEVRPTIEQLRTRAKDAWRRRNPIEWKRLNEQLTALANLLRPPLAPGDRLLGLASEILKFEIPVVREAAGGRFDAEVHEIEAEALSVFANALAAEDPQRGCSELIQFYHKKIVPMRRRLGLEETASAALTAEERQGLLAQIRAASTGKE